MDRRAEGSQGSLAPPGSVAPHSRIALRHSVVLWLAAGSLALLFCVRHLSATLVDGAFLPADHDSFYHARRILDALSDPLRMYQFDPRIHVPEGSWITWPWGYDTAMAFATRALVAATGAANPMTILAFVAPAWTFVNAALALGIASRLGLSLPLQALAVLFFAISPLTHNIHRVGMIDHHFIEYSFVLASLYFGMGWFRDRARHKPAIALALVLGAAPAFHTGLFVLQVPFLLALAGAWVAGQAPAPRAALAFAAALVGTTAIFLVPSQPFRAGEFSFYLHSWFHLYVAGCTGMACIAASCAPRSGRWSLALALLGLALAVPLLREAKLGAGWISGELEYLGSIAEAGGIAGSLARGELWILTQSYSAFFWLAPFALLWMCRRTWRAPRGEDLYFLAQALFGTFLLVQQYRLHYFGSFALILPVCRLVEDLRAQPDGPLASRRALAATLGAAVLAMSPGLLGLGKRYPVASDFQYMLTRGIYPALKAACERAPGVVLAEHGDGHYIRFHTECSVIANNFILTPQHIEKISLSEMLLRAPSAGALARAPYLRYILVRRSDNVLDESRGCGVDCPENDGLRRELLADDRPPPSRLRLLEEIRLGTPEQSQPLARLFEIVP